MLALLFVVATSSTVLFAQAPKDAAPCSEWNPAGPALDAEAIIASCTRLIESGELTGRALARAYLTRIIVSSREPRTVDHGRIIADATKVIELDTQERFAYLLRCGSYLERGEHDRAIQDATRYIELDPADWNAFYVRSSAYAAKGEYDLAIADDTKAVEMAPKHPSSWAKRASTYLKAGKTAEALSDMNQALSMKYPAAFYYFQRGQIFEAMGQTQDAIADYRNALRLEPNHRGYRAALTRLGAAP